MKVALFVTCLADALFPQVGRATVALLERLGHEVVVPAGPDLLRADARQHRLPPRGACRSCANHVRRLRAAYDAIVAPSGSCVGSVRHQHAAVARRAGRRTRWPTRAEALARRTYELSEFLVDVLGRHRRRRVLPAPGHLPPDLPLAADAAGRRPAAAAAARGRRASTWSSCPRPTSAAASAARSR